MQQKIRHRIMFRPVTDPSPRFLFFSHKPDYR